MTDRPTSATQPGSDLPGRLEALWRQGQHPNLAAFLAANGPVTVPSLLAVVLLDQEGRYRAGEQHRCEEYLSA